MPIISWSLADVLQQKVLEAGPQKVVICDYKGPQASSSGKGINLYLTFRLTDGNVAGKEHMICLSSGMKNTSLLGDLQFFPMRTISLIHAAINNIPFKDIQPGQGEIDDMLDKPLIVVFGVEIANGSPVNIITGFSSADEVSQARPF